MATTATLEDRIGKVEGLLATKDIWDMLGAIGSVAVPVVVAFLGVYLPLQLNKAQRERELIAAESSARLAKASIIPPLMDALLSPDPARRRLAIGTVLLALPEEGPELTRIVAASDPNPQVKRFANASLDRHREALVTALFSDDPPARIEAAKSVLAGWREDSVVVQLLLRYSETHRDNTNGVYNAAVVLGGLSAAALAPSRDLVLRFADWAGTQGPKTKQATDVLRRRVR